jgi:myo-inositol-1(or 4)-monophosphatase
VEQARIRDLLHIEAALTAATAILEDSRFGAMKAEVKKGGDPITAADRAVDRLLFEMLPRDGEGWLSEETVDGPSRLTKRRVWVVDPLDGTKEFLAGIPEWCISIGLIEDGNAVAGGIANPATGEVFLGSRETGLRVKGPRGAVASSQTRDETLVLASRSETLRGEWHGLVDASFTVQPMGSVAYKLARVAAGLADATWTFVPKHEWDVAGGVALVLASGGVVRTVQGDAPIFNRPQPRLDGLVAFSERGRQRFAGWLDDWPSGPLCGTGSGLPGRPRNR